MQGGSCSLVCSVPAQAGTSGSRELGLTPFPQGLHSKAELLHHRSRREMEESIIPVALTEGIVLDIALDLIICASF